jgi:hypothetical protein
MGQEHKRASAVVMFMRNGGGLSGKSQCGNRILQGHGKTVAERWFNTTAVVRRGIFPESRAHGIVRSVEVHDPACQSSLNTIHMCSIIISCLQCLQAPFWDALGPSYSRGGDAEQRLGPCLVSRPSCFLP